MIALSRKGRSISQIIQLPPRFNSFQCFCKHLGEVWNIKLLDIYTLHKKQKQKPQDRHPAIVAAYIAYVCTFSSDDDCRGFLIDVNTDVLHLWDVRVAEGRYSLWKEFANLIDTYFPPDQVKPETIDLVMRIFNDEGSETSH